MTSAEQLLIDATLSIAKLQAWLEAQNEREIYYLNGDVPYVDEAEVLAVIPVEKRTIYQTVNIAGVEYWFTGDPLVLSPKVQDMGIADGSITLAKLANITGISVVGKKTTGPGTPEVITLADLKILLGLEGTNSGDQGLGDYVLKVLNYSLVHIDDIAKIHAPGSDDQDLTAIENAIDELYTLIGMPPVIINLPAGANITDRLLTATLPSGWTFTAVGDTGANLQIEHTMTGRSIAHVNVKVIDPITGTRMLVPYRDAYSGINEDGETLTIEGLATNELPIILILIFY